MQSASKLIRSADGKMRVDSGQLSTIFDPGKQQTILLDHIKKEARIMPFQPPPMPQFPQFQMPQAPQAPKAPPIKVEDLGKRVIDGLEAEGKKYLVPPEMPQKPQIPGIPQPPQPPQLPITREVWTSTKLQLPILQKTVGPFGEQICKCLVKEAGEPPAQAFQIPPDYKQIAGNEIVKPPEFKPPEVKPPDLKAPELPKAPKIPKLS